MSRVLFLSRTSAHMAIIKVGRKAGVDDETIAARGAAFPVFSRGELCGWEGWVPHGNGTERKPILEQDYEN